MEGLSRVPIACLFLASFPGLGPRMAALQTGEAERKINIPGAVHNQLEELVAERVTPRFEQHEVMLQDLKTGQSNIVT